jgi:tRNA pseudouridine55 synthase
LLNIAKPAGVTSRDVVDAVADRFRGVKCGHAGTLDPLATGVIVICCGPATRLIPLVQEQPKQYVAEFLLGRRSDTDDVTGNVIESPPAIPPSRELIASLLPQFVGDIEQVPPRFSAVRTRGRRAYDLARAGKDVNLPPRRVTVHAIDLLDYKYPRLELRIDCGSGTYVRSIGRDLGELLGGGAVLSSLVRTRIGAFPLNTALPLAELAADTLDRAAVPTSAAVAHLPQYHCNATEQEDLRHGRRFVMRMPVSADGRGRIAVVNDSNEFVAIAEHIAASNELAPRLVLRSSTCWASEP